MIPAKKERCFAGLTRSELMSRIKSKGNKKTEIAFLVELRRQKLTGWRRHAKLPGRPDFVFQKAKVAIFLDGCFWHGCPRHFRLPRTRRTFWDAKIKTNKSRDRKNDKLLRSIGWAIIHIWEHDLTKSRLQRSLSRIKAKIATGRHEI